MSNPIVIFNRIPKKSGETAIEWRLMTRKPGTPYYQNGFLLGAEHSELFDPLTDILLQARKATQGKRTDVYGGFEVKLVDL